MTAALITCADRHTNGTLPYYQCLCSGLQHPRFQRAKYYFCRRAAQVEEAVSVEARAEIGKIVGIVLGSLALLLILGILFRRFHAQITQLLRACFAHCGVRQGFDECGRMFCICCVKKSKAGPDGAAANANLSGRPTSRCGRCCYSDSFLAALEFICDCDCFQGRRTPKYIIPIIGKGRRPATANSVQDLDAEEAMVQHQQPRRMRSVRRAPPPPMPQPPSFAPEERVGTGKRRAPLAPSAPVNYPQKELADVHHQHQQELAPPHYSSLHQPAVQPFTRAAPPRVSQQFTDQLSKVIKGRRSPSQTDL